MSIYKFNIDIIHDADVFDTTNTIGVHITKEYNFFYKIENKILKNIYFPSCYSFTPQSNCEENKSEN